MNFNLNSPKHLFKVFDVVMFEISLFHSCVTFHSLLSFYLFIVILRLFSIEHPFLTFNSFVLSLTDFKMLCVHWTKSFRNEDRDIRLKIKGLLGKSVKASSKCPVKRSHKNLLQNVSTAFYYFSFKYLGVLGYLKKCLKGINNYNFILVFEGVC
jgi:hypothetical protein